MLVPLNLWLPELLSTPNCLASSRCLPAVAKSGWMTLQNIRIFFFSDIHLVVLAVSMGCNLGAFLIQARWWKKFLLALSIHSPLGQCPWPQCNSKLYINAGITTAPPLYIRKTSQFLVIVICWTVKPSRWECLWKLLLLYLKSLYLLGALDKSQLAVHCGVLWWQFM